MLPHLAFIYNATPHSVTGYSPYVLMFGWEPIVPLNHLLDKASCRLDEDYTAKQTELIRLAHKVATDRLLRAASASKKHYDKRARACPLHVGDRVLLQEHGFRKRHKLCKPFQRGTLCGGQVQHRERSVFDQASQWWGRKVGTSGVFDT